MLHASSASLSPRNRHQEHFRNPPEDLVNRRRDGNTKRRENAVTFSDRPNQQNEGFAVVFQLADVFI